VSLGWKGNEEQRRGKKKERKEKEKCCVGWGEKKEEEKKGEVVVQREKLDKVRHVVRGEWLGEDNEILPTNRVTPHGKGGISFIFKTLNLCELKWDPI